MILCEGIISSWLSSIHKVVFHTCCYLHVQNPAFFFTSPWKVERCGIALQNVASKHILLELDLFVGQELYPNPLLVCKPLANSASSLLHCYTYCALEELHSLWPCGCTNRIPLFPPSLLHLLGDSFIQSRNCLCA